MGPETVAQGERMHKPSDYIRMGWCRGTMARDVEGYAVPSYSDEASSWCLIGAIERVYWDNPQLLLICFEKVRNKIKEMGGVILPLALWNDELSRTKEEVIKLLESIGE